MRKTVLLAALGLLCLAATAQAGNLMEFNRMKYAAEQGDPNAMAELALSLYNGNFQGMRLEQNYDEAYQWLRKADGASGGNAELEYLIGRSFQYGQGTPQSLENARYWYDAAARRGSGQARDALQEIGGGGGYPVPVIGQDPPPVPVIGGGVGPVEPPHHHDPGVDRLMRAAHEGNADAQYQLGMALLEGEHGLPHDASTAFHWIHQSAEQGYGRAERQLSEMYQRGIGTRHSSHEAREWDHRARRQGF